MAIWGSAFLVIEYAVAGLTPAWITAGRIWVGTVVLLAVVFARRRGFSVSRRDWKYFALMALVGNCMPFFLITWGQQFITSGEAGILMAVVPLQVIALAHFVVPGDRLTAARIVGFVIGFFGVLLLFEPGSARALFTEDNSVAKLAVLAAGSCYAIATVLAKLQPNQSPYQTAAGVMIAGSLMMALAAPVMEPVPTAPFPPAALVAVAALGLLATGLATVVYFYVAQHAGAGFLSLTNYFVPCVAAALGTWVAGEALGLRTWLGLAVVLSGVATAQFLQLGAARRT